MMVTRIPPLLRQRYPVRLNVGHCSKVAGRLSSRHGALAGYAQHRCMSAAASSHLSGVRDILQISDEVADAIASNKPVVALESTIYTHGALGNDLARDHSDLVRSNGAIPAIIAIVDGVPKVGVTSEDIVRMIESGSAVKASRRDIAYLVGMVSSIQHFTTLIHYKNSKPSLKHLYISHQLFMCIMS